MTDSFRKSRKIVLPCFSHTELCQASDQGAMPICLENESFPEGCYERTRQDSAGVRVDGQPASMLSNFNFYPIVLNADASPWDEANVYILSKLENTLRPNMSTFDGLADDLVAYRRYIDEEGIDWRIFTKQKLNRPTYRYSAALERAIGQKLVSSSLAGRRMNSVISFYRWLQDKQILVAAYEPWVDKRTFLHLSNAHGRDYTKEVLTTDVSIKIPVQSDPYDGTIDDGGKLRPLSKEEQGWVLEALFARENTEMTLIHLFALLSGARIQTVLTARLGNFGNLSAAQLGRFGTAPIRIPVGLGTGIDTKFHKKITLHLPQWFYKMLLTYSESERARRRRELSELGESKIQYLFLTKYGDPFYTGKHGRFPFDANNKRRQQIRGNAIRKFIVEAVIPYIRTKYDPAFSYQFHDLRASFGMNLTDSQMELVAQGKRSLSKARQYIRVRMGHDNYATTDKYLGYRDNQKLISQVTDDYDLHLKKIAEEALYRG